MGNWKELFGLGDLDIGEEEIVQRIEEAKERNMEEVEFILKNGEKVKVRLKNVNVEGIRRSGTWNG